MRRMAGRWHKCGTNERRRDDSSHMGGQKLLIEYQQVGPRSATKKTDRELNYLLIAFLFAPSVAQPSTPASFSDRSAFSQA